MTRKVGKIRAATASLVLAGAAIFGSASSAQNGVWTPTEECHRYVSNGCAANWQRWGYAQESDCVWGQYCLVCMGGYMCGVLSYEVDWAVKPDAAEAW